MIRAPITRSLGEAPVGTAATEETVATADLVGTVAMAETAVTAPVLTEVRVAAGTEVVAEPEATEAMALMEGMVEEAAIQG